jgi:shikimate kinase
MSRPLVVLVGAPGSGKTSVGTLLAERLDLSFRDTDADVEALTGMTIAELFVEKGEEYFRDLEAETVRAALDSCDGVLSLGGGAVIRDETRAALGRHRVAYLDVDLHEAAKRVGMNVARPLLLGNVRGRLGKLLDERRPLYESVATMTITTVGRTPEEIAEELGQVLR